MKQKKSSHNQLYWLPRLLSVLFIVFISIFALDVFNEPRWFLALFMHLIPSFILVLLTIVAWKNERIGGILFLCAGIATIVFFHSIVIAVPSFIVGTLFLVENYLYYKK